MNFLVSLFWSVGSKLTIIVGVIFTTSLSVASNVPVVVKSENVCMVTNMYYGRSQSPVKFGGKTYYASCETCKTTLTKESKTRLAVDPASGKTIDKAKAVIAAQNDQSVLYFENKKNFEEYRDAMSSFKRPGQPGGHSHH